MQVLATVVLSQVPLQSSSILGVELDDPATVEQLRVCGNVPRLVPSFVLMARSWTPFQFPLYHPSAGRVTDWFESVASQL